MDAEEFIKGFQELRQRLPRISVSGYQNKTVRTETRFIIQKNTLLCLF